MFFTFDQSRQTTPEYKRLRALEKVLLLLSRDTRQSFKVHVAGPKANSFVDDAIGWGVLY
jgi:hypothetical protein